MQNSNKLIKSIMDLGLERQPAVLLDEPAADPIDRFKRIMSFLETSDNPKAVHKTMKTGIHVGTTAQGRTGLMPKTAKEFANRRKLAGNFDDLDRQVINASDLEVQDMIKNNPELYSRYEDDLARFVMDKTGGDMELAATKWLYGHNDSVENSRKKLEKNPKYRKRFQEAKKLILQREERDRQLQEQIPELLRRP